MEVNPTFASNIRWQGLVKQVHKHSFAGSDVPVQIESLWCIGRRGGRGRLIPAEEARKLIPEVDILDVEEDEYGLSAYFGDDAPAEGQREGRTSEFDWIGAASGIDGGL